MDARLVREGPLAIVDYRCGRGPDDAPFPERHERFSLSFVRRGSFGCHTRGRTHELVAGSLLVGRPGEEFTCTHDHHGEGDECLSIQLAPELLADFTDEGPMWRAGALPPLATLVPVAERAQAALEGVADLDLAEAALLLVGRFVALDGTRPAAVRRPCVRTRRQVCRAADWIDANSSREIDLLHAAAQSGLSAWHFLRSFHAVLGLTPHQYLLRCRLRKAARLLLEGELPVTEVALQVGFGDLSNFVRTFRRATGVSPGRFRSMA